MLKQGYTKPQLYRYNGVTEKKEWYVGFRFTCPARQERKAVQVRLGINFFKSARERDQEGRAVTKLVTECLNDGWNPFDCNIETYMRSKAAEQPHAAETMQTTPDGIPIPTPDTPLAEALQLAYQIRKPELKKKTKANYETGLRYAVPATKTLGIDTLPLSKVKRLHLRMLVDQIGKDRQIEFDKRGKGEMWTPNAFNRYKSYLSAFFDALESLDAVDFNPCHKIDDKEPIESGIHRHATEAEIAILKAELPKLHMELYQLLRFEHATGMRPNEIVQTRFDMIDWLNSLIKLSYVEGKTKVYRVVPIPKFLLNWLKARQGNQPGSYYIFGKKLNPGPKTITQNWLSRLWTKCVKVKLGLNISLYSFKGLGGEAKREAGIEEKAVSVGWGHTSTKTSRIYLKKEGERLRQAIIDNTPEF